MDQTIQMQEMTRSLFRILLFAAVSMVSMGVYAHEDDDSPVRFIENKGQWEDFIHYTAEIPGGKIFLEQDQITFSFCDLTQLHDRWFYRKPGESTQFPLDCHAFTLRFSGGNTQPTLIPNEAEEAYYNYFTGNDRSKWASNVQAYESVLYQEVYPGIDFIIYGTDEGLKYDFIVRPGADPNLIRMDFEGLESIFLHAGELHLNTTLNKIIDERPVSFQNGDQIPTDFQLNGTTASFSFPKGYSTTEELRIDPTLVFSTFTGSSANNFGFTATYDQDGNLFAGGIAYGQGYPITLGVYQSVFAGTFDMSITKFNDSGTHLWSTYIGGNSADQPHSMIADLGGDLFIYGRSVSNDFPVTTTAYDTSHNGGYDIVVSRLSDDGTSLLASTYIGGADNDGMNKSNAYIQQGIKHNYADDARGEIVLDDQGGVYVATCTQSGDFPIFQNSYQTSLGGTQDACVFKFNTDLTTLNWSTYLGGSNDDAAYSLKVDDQNRVFVTGGTESTNFPTQGNVVSPSVSPSPVPNQDINGFITHFSANGTTLVNSTYITTSNYNQCYFIELDADENVYVFGQKNGPWNTFPTGIWSTPGGGQFLSKLSNDLGSFTYSTQYGTSNSFVNISPTAFLVDVCGFIYMSGWGGPTNFNGNTNGLPTSGNALQSSTDGGDLYLLVLQPDAAGIEYATFMGGPLSNEHVDGGTSRFNKKSEVYQSVCAGCQGNSDFPTTGGALSANNNSVGCNLACFKLDLDNKGVVADFSPDPDTAGCAPQFIQFINNSEGGNQYFWNFGDNTTSTQFSPSHNYPLPGTYIVTLVAVDSTTCNIADTVTRVIEVLPIPTAFVTPDTSICEGESISLNAFGGMNYSWSPPLYLNQTTGSAVLSNPTSNVTYSVIVSNGSGCEDTADVAVTVLPRPVAFSAGDTLICPGDTANISAGGGSNYSWSPSGSLTNPNQGSTSAYPSVTTNYLVTVTAANGCTDEDTVRVEVSAIQADAGNDVDLCIGESVQLSGTGGGDYDWVPPTNLSQTNIANPIADPSNDITYYLTVTNSIGCRSVDSVVIIIRPLPIVDAGGDQIICDDDSVQLGATGANNYAWSPSTNLSNPNIGNPYASPDAPITYHVVGTDQYGCRNQDSLFVDVIPAPTAAITGEGRICQDSSIQLFATGGLTYLWTPALPLDDPTSPNPIATLSSTTIFTVTVFAANGCDDDETVIVPVTPTPVVEIDGPDLVCLDRSARLFGSGADQYLWSTGSVSDHIVVTPPIPTWYTLVGYVEGCPSLPDSHFVDVDDILPIADFYADPDSGWVPLVTQFHNLSNEAVTYRWDFGDGGTSFEFEPEHTYTDTGRFEVELVAIDANGCFDTAYARIIVGADFSIYVPNAFTPNGDGVNDYFSTPWFGVREFHIMLYDRWGMLIYESYDPNFEWGGIYKDRDVQEGVYTYVIEAKGHIGEKVKRAGTVTLYR